MLHKLKRRKYARQALVSFYGINTCTANKIIGVLGFHPQTRDFNLLIYRNRDRVRYLLASLRIDFRLRLIVFSRICLLIFTGTLRGIRHLQGLPCRGQRTHANGRTPRRLKKAVRNFPFKFNNSRRRFQKVLKSKHKKPNFNPKSAKKPISKTKAKAKAKPKNKAKKKK